MEKIIKKAEILIEALPYIQKLYGKTVVVKYGGNAMINDALKDSVMEDITLLKYIGMNPIVIHGGGPAISAALKSSGIETQFVNGLRKTDEKTMEIVQMVLIGKTNKDIVSRIGSKGGKAIGISGIDAGIIKCRQHYPIIDGVKTDIGYVGEITGIDATSLRKLTEGEYIPVISPIGIGEDGKSYNINADTVAGEVAIALKAEKLILLTDVEGVKTNRNDGDILHALSIDEVHSLIDSGVIEGGMIPKVLGCVNAIENGVGRTHIIDGRIPHCILLEIFTGKGIGTMIALNKEKYYDKETVWED
ncbi:MAG: acetylglutamate kinase [Clostridia bacterium]|nr:acetylglutamate kinase [Clostridia bacterium]MBN2884175.1 acetylglutamate kinase [Clostridia bacterium]